MPEKRLLLLFKHCFVHIISCVFHLIIILLKIITISLESHASMTVIKILSCRLESTSESYLGKDQFGFRKGHGTTDATMAHCLLCERTWNTTIKPTSATLTVKAFDRVHGTKLMTILQNIGVDWRDRKLIWNLYNKQAAHGELETVCPLHVLLAEG